MSQTKPKKTSKVAQRMIGSGRSNPASAKAATMRVTNKEFIGTILGGNTSSWVMNPQNNIVFPSLSMTASNYDRYQFHSLKMHFVSGAGTTGIGRYAVGWDADSEDDNVSDEVAVLNLPVNKGVAVWENCSLVVPGMKEPKFLSYFRDKLNDHGQFMFFATSSSNNLAVYVEYDVTLMDSSTQGSSAVLKQGFDALFTTNVYSPYSGPQLIKNLPISKTFLLAAGRYMLNIRICGSTVTQSPWSFNAISGGTVVTRQISTLIDSTIDIMARTVVLSSTQGVQITMNDSVSGFVTNRSYLVISPLTTRQYNDLDDSLLPP